MDAYLIPWTVFPRFAVAFIWQHCNEYRFCICLVCVLDQVSGSSWQYGGWAAQSCIQITGPVRPARWAIAAFLVYVLPQPAGYAHHTAAGVTCRNQPQKVCVSSQYNPLLMFGNDLPMVWAVWCLFDNLPQPDLKHLQGGNLGSLCVSIEHHSTPSSNGSAVDAGWRSEWGRAASAWTDPVNAAAACAASQPAAGQLHSATRDHTTLHGEHSLDIDFF